MGWFSKKKERPDATDVAIRSIVLRHVVLVRIVAAAARLSPFKLYLVD